MEWIQIVVPPTMIIIGGILSWLIKTKTEELKATEERLTEDRRKIYIKLLEPYISIFSDISGKGTDKAIRQITSYEYKKTSFELNLFGSDSVVKAYNNLMTHVFNAEKTGKQDHKEMFRLWGKVLLEIRKSIGNKKSKLDEMDMLRTYIKDIDDVYKD